MVLWISFYGVVWLLPTALAVYGLAVLLFKKRFNRWPLWIFFCGWLFIGAMVLAPHTQMNWVAWFLD